jgi:hypothetical protein
MTDEFWDDLFHGAAWAAFIDQAIAEQGWPDEKQTRLRTFRYYEKALADRNRTPAASALPSKTVPR